jgi:signal transduction histidine kinase/CheY-like chemotaxis protein
MNKLKYNITEAELLRKKAEKKLKKKDSKVRLISSDSDIIKLNNELSVHQIELELQNEELVKTKEELENAVGKLIKVNKDLELALQSNTDTNRFISILAHDLRSPFSVILGYCELLSYNLRQFSSDEIEKLVNEINKSTQVTFNLLEDLLKWARMNSGRIPFKPQKLNFKNIWDDINKILAPDYFAKNVTLSYSISDEIEVIADSDMLKTILRNLISNAIKYNNTGGFVKVTAEQTASNIIFTVSDNGIGMQPDYLSSLFDLAEIHPTPDTSGEQGLGLGLFLCKGFVEKQGGKIWAESINGKGSFFYFTLPIEAKPAEEYVSLKSLKGKKADNLKILIADDNESLRLILGELLKKYSKEILFAGNGFEAVDFFKKNPDIDLILMDFFMPEMNGYEATKQIRQLNSNVVIFVETSDTLSNITEEFSNVKIDDFFPKPYNKNFLNELIIKHFNDRPGSILNV